MGKGGKITSATHEWDISSYLETDAHESLLCRALLSRSKVRSCRGSALSDVARGEIKVYKFFHEENESPKRP